MNKAAIYARFSCSKQREASIDDQLRVCREWCGREGYEVVAEYCDHAMSGKTDERPEFQRMIANAGESDIVLVYMMDRFSRDAFQAPIYKRELATRGVKLVSALEQIPDSPEGIIYEKLLEGLAACESAKTSVRTKRGMEGNALKCKTNGVRVYGYRADANDEYEVVEEQAAIVREAFARKLDGEPVNSIARDFALRGITTYSGKPCSYTMVWNMLRNRKYTGMYSWGGIEKMGGMPAIVDDATFELAQAVRPRKERVNESWGKFALAGRVICSECGHSMPGGSGRGRSGAKYEYYTCKCKSQRNVRRDWLEGEIAERIRELLEDRGRALDIARLVADSAKDDSAREEARRALRNADRGIGNIVTAIERGLPAEEFQARLEELRAQKAAAHAKLAVVEDAAIDVEDFADFLQYGATLDDETLLDAFVHQVMLTPERVFVVLNCDEKGEPSRFDFARVRLDSEWLPLLKHGRTAVYAYGRSVVVSLERAA